MDLLNLSSRESYDDNNAPIQTHDTKTGTTTDTKNYAGKVAQFSEAYSTDIL